MPELPEVETVRRGLAPVMEGQQIVKVHQRRADLRFSLPERFCERLEGTTIEHLGRQAKFLTARLSSGEILIMHLGMTGRFTVSGEFHDHFHHASGLHARHDHVIIELGSGTAVTYNDPRRFGFMELWPEADFASYPRLASVGPEPLSNRFSPDYLDTALAGRSAPIKASLLDQKVIAGLGNIYVCEALFRSGISPKRRSATVPGRRAQRLARAVNEVIREAIEAGGSSISDFAATDGSLGYFQHSFDVYDREGKACRRCTTQIRRIVQSGRSSFFCPRCQR